MKDHARRTGPAVEAHYQLINWLIPTVERFPKAQKFLLGDRIQATALFVPEARWSGEAGATGKFDFFARLEAGSDPFASLPQIVLLNSPPSSRMFWPVM